MSHEYEDRDLEASKDYRENVDEVEENLMR